MSYERVTGQPQTDEHTDELVVYELGSWPRRAVVALQEHLDAAGLGHGWDDGELHVDPDDEEEVDELVALVETAFGIDDDGRGSVPDSDTAYDLAHWTEAVRAEAERRLDEAGIRHGWEYGSELVVREDDVDAVNDILDGLEHPEALAPEEDDGGDDALVLSELFLAADRLRRDPGDADATARLAAALRSAEVADVPYGVDPETWMRARALGETLRARLISGDLPFTIQDTATELRAHLAPLV